MSFMNEYDIEDAVRAFTPEEFPNNAKGARVLQNLMRWTNRNSDGWPYWSKPSKAAAKLQDILPSPYHYDAEDITDAELKKALTPIKRFLTTQGVPHEEVLDV